MKKWITPRNIGIVVAIAALVATSKYCRADTYDHTFEYAILYDDGTLHVVLDDGAASCVALTTIKLAAMVRRATTVPHYEALVSPPDWWGWTSLFYFGQNSNTERALFYEGYTSVHGDSTTFDIAMDPDMLYTTFPIAYRLDCGALPPSDWFYEEAYREMDPVDVLTGLTLVSAACVNEIPGQARVTVSGLADESARLRLEIYDTDATDWATTTSNYGDGYAPWVDAATGPLTGGHFLVDTPLTTDGRTRVYLETLDGVVHGPVAGPTLSVGSCADITVE